MMGLHMGTVVLLAVLGLAVCSAWFGYTRVYADGDVAVLVAIALFITSLMFLGVFALQRVGCDTAGSKLGVDTEHSWVLGCTVEMGDRQVPIEQVRFNEDGELAEVTR